MVVKCKNCKEPIFLDTENIAFMNKAIYCEHCKKIVFYTELPFAIGFSVIKWFIFFIIIALNPSGIFVFVLIWSILEKMFMFISYKYLIKKNT